MQTAAAALARSRSGMAGLTAPSFSTRYLARTAAGTRCGQRTGLTSTLFPKCQMMRARTRPMQLPLRVLTLPPATTLAKAEHIPALPGHTLQ